MTAIGSSQTSGKQITGILTLSMKPDPTESIPPGYVCVYRDLTDDDAVGLPTNATALLNGRAFAGISTGFNATQVTTATQPADNQVPVQKDGIAEAVLKANTACIDGQDAAYDPADGGVVVPYTSQSQVRIGKFAQTKSGSSSPQFVGVELAPGGAGGGGGSMMLWSGPQAGTVSSTAENAYSQAGLTIPANFLRVGDVIEYNAALTLTNQNGADTLQVRWKIGTNTIVQTASSYDPATGDSILVRGYLSVSAIGASGVINAVGHCVYGAAATAGTSIVGEQNVTVDTTAAISISLTEQFSASSANDQCDLKSAWVRLIRKTP
jgi:hypothetical protein